MSGLLRFWPFSTAVDFALAGRCTATGVAALNFDVDDTFGPLVIFSTGDRALALDFVLGWAVPGAILDLARNHAGLYGRLWGFRDSAHRRLSRLSLLVQAAFWVPFCAREMCCARCAAMRTVNVVVPP